MERAAKILLDFIGVTETGGSYDTIYGHNEKHLPKPITEMTVAQVLKAQDEWRKKWGNSAAGRYQFIPATLRQTVNEGAISINDRWDATTQDKAAYHLLKKRGFEKFLSGGMSREHFMIQLAMEWASFPVPIAMKGASRRLQRGQSYYAGDGLNKALVSAAKVEKLLDQVLAAHTGAPVTTTKATPPIVQTSNVETIKVVQQLLRDRGWPEVGHVDGKMGPRTRDAILAFRRHASLPLVPEVDAALVDALMSASVPSRPVSPERANAQVEDISGSTGVRMDQYAKWGGVILAALGFSDGAIDLVKTTQTVQYVGKLTDQIIAIGPNLLIVAAGCAVAYFAHRAIRWSLERYRSGNHV